MGDYGGLFLGLLVMVGLHSIFFDVSSNSSYDDGSRYDGNIVYPETS